QFGDPNRDGIADFDDEFVEIINATENALDLAGWTLSTFGTLPTSTLRHTFPSGTLLPPGAAVVIFQSVHTESIRPADFGGAVVQVASSGYLFLNDEGDTLTLADPLGGPVSVRSYSEADTSESSSLTRSPD